MNCNYVDPDIKVCTKLHVSVQKVLQLGIFCELIISAQPKQCECEIQNKYLLALFSLMFFALNVILYKHFI